MAEAKKTGKADAKGEAKATTAAASSGKTVQLAVAGVFALLAALAGLHVSKSMHAGPQQAAAETGPAAPDDSILPPLPENENTEYKYHTFERVTISLRTDRGSTFLIAVIVAKVKEPYFDAVTQQVARKQHEIVDMFNNYLGGMSVKEVLGTTNQNRIKRELKDRLNSLLWPGQKPGIHQILLEEFHTN